jgi:Ca2+-transporting ATPase
MLLAPFLGMPLALLPLQILWINLVTDGLPGLALGVENAERNTMRRPPYPPNENIFARGIGRDILFIGFLMGILSLGVGYWYWRMDQPIWQTMVFTTLTLSEMGYVMAIRSSRDSLFSIGIFSNRALIGAVVLTTILQVAVVYVPFLQTTFKTMALPLRDLGIAALLSTSLFFVVELQKWLIRRFSPA